MPFDQCWSTYGSGSIHQGNGNCCMSCRGFHWVVVRSFSVDRRCGANRGFASQHQRLAASVAHALTRRRRGATAAVRAE
jgi:hypothetical protein